MRTITTIGLDIAKSVFKSAALMRMAMWFFASIEAAVCAVVLSEAASVPHWYRGLCVVALLVA